MVTIAAVTRETWRRLFGIPGVITARRIPPFILYSNVSPFFLIKMTDRDCRVPAWIFSASDEEIGIARIQVRSGMFTTYTISGADLARSAIWQNCSVQVEEDHVWITPTSSDPYLVLDHSASLIALISPLFLFRPYHSLWMMRVVLFIKNALLG